LILRGARKKKDKDRTEEDQKLERRPRVSRVLFTTIGKEKERKGWVEKKHKVNEASHWRERKMKKANGHAPDHWLKKQLLVNSAAKSKFRGSLEVRWKGRVKHREGHKLGGLLNGEGTTKEYDSPEAAGTKRKGKGGGGEMVEGGRSGVFVATTWPSEGKVKQPSQPSNQGK